MPINPSIAHPGTLSSSQSAAGTGSAYASDNNAPVLFVNTVTGQAGNNGLTPANAMPTIAEAFAAMAIWEAAQAHSADNTIINVLGVIAEQLTTPLSGEAGVGVSGVTIQGLVGGNNRHDDGARWKQAATAGNAPLITVRGQGWVFRHLLMVPQATFSAIRLRRQEDATYPDASHAIIDNVRFIGNETTPAGIGLEDYGGNSHYRVTNCEFSGLVSGYTVTNQSIDIPNHNVFIGNMFLTNTNHFNAANSWAIIQGNHFMTSGTVNLSTAFGNTGVRNHVALNFFQDNAADIDPAHGYDGNATDFWANYTLNQAALQMGDPA